MPERLNLQLEDGCVIGDHAEWLLGQGVSLSEVLGFASALEDMRAIPCVIAVDDDPLTERDVRSTTLPSPAQPYSNVA